MASSACLFSLVLLLLLALPAHMIDYFKPGHTTGEAPEFAKKRDEEDRLPHCGVALGAELAESLALKAAEVAAAQAAKNAVQATIAGPHQQQNIGGKGGIGQGYYFSQSYSLGATLGSTLSRVTSELSGGATAQSTTFAQYLALYTTTSGTSTSSVAVTASLQATTGEQLLASGVSSTTNAAAAATAAATSLSGAGSSSTSSYAATTTSSTQTGVGQIGLAEVLQTFASSASTQSTTGTTSTSRRQTSSSSTTAYASSLNQQVSQVTTSATQSALTSGGIYYGAPTSERCSPYVMCILQGSIFGPPYVGLYGKSVSQAGQTQILIEGLNVHRVKAVQQSPFATLVNQLGPGSCDYYQQSLLWQTVSNFCSGYTSALVPIYNEPMIQQAVYCTPAYNPSSQPQAVQLLYLHQLHDTLQLVRVNRNHINGTLPVFTLPVGEGQFLEQNQYRAAQLMQGYTLLICPLLYSRPLELVYENANTTSSSTILDTNIWSSPSLSCVLNSNESGMRVMTLSLANALDFYNLTLAGPVVTSQGGDTDEPVLLISLPKNYADLGQTVYQGHALRLRAARVTCAILGRLKRVCNDCRL